ncbi:glycosyltransferase family 2 protein [Streptacidiphilus monticola]
MLRTPENSGLSAARNLGLDAAEGRWIMFFDGDDWLGPGYLPSSWRSPSATTPTSCAPTTSRSRRSSGWSTGPPGTSQRRPRPAGRHPARQHPHHGGLPLRLGRRGPQPAARPRAAPLRPRAAHRRGPALDLAAAPQRRLLRRRRPARTVLPTGRQQLAHADRRRPPTRLPARLRRRPRAGRGGS